MAAQMSERDRMALLTREDSAAHLGCCWATLAAMAKRGELPSVVVGKRSRRTFPDAVLHYGRDGRGR